MDVSVQKHDAVYTADGEHLGNVVRVYTQPDEHEVNPKLKLYKHYMLLANESFGDDYYVPTFFIAQRDDKAKRVELTLKFKQVLHETMARKPQFIALGQATVE
ncbi:MAG: hypothetical protein KDD89_01255 [Anaerolineales bacterium]|nr:hypothetical protein [Anaerolineales bacterium]